MELNIIAYLVFLYIWNNRCSPFPPSRWHSAQPLGLFIIASTFELAPIISVSEISLSQSECMWVYKNMYFTSCICHKYAQFTFRQSRDLHSFAFLLFLVWINLWGFFFLSFKCSHLWQIKLYIFDFFIMFVWSLIFDIYWRFGSSLAIHEIDNKHARIILATVSKSAFETERHISWLYNVETWS